MQIGSLLNPASLTHITPPSRPNPSATASAPATAHSTVAPPAASPAASPSSTPPRASSGGHGHGTSTADLGSAASVAATLYTTTVAGKTYTGDVEYSGGQYVVSVPGLLGASATGSTAQAAEESLGSVISAIA